MESLKILALTITGAIAYGILQDQVTARICVEYFTVGHPPVFRTTSATLLGFGWGIIATWWVGVLLGVPLALIARWGARPKLCARDFFEPLFVLMGAVAALAVSAGLLGYGAARMGWAWIDRPLVAALVPAERHALYLADAWAHSAAYAGGVVGAMIVGTWAWQRRGQHHASRGPFRAH